MPFNKEQRQQYYLKNRDYVLLQKKEYYDANKDKIGMRVRCPLCYATVSKSYLKNHQKTIKCQLNSLHPIKPLSNELPRESQTDK